MTEPFVPMNLRDLVFVDLETTGLDCDVHEILEIAAVRTTHGAERVVASFEHRVTPERIDVAEASALAINGYNPTEWLDAVACRVALVDWCQILGRDEECIVVGHNPAFDQGFLRVGAKRLGIALPRAKYLIDTASMAWPLCSAGSIDRLGLDRLCQLYKIPNDGAHRAMTDVRRCIAVYRALLGKKGSIR